MRDTAVIETVPAVSASDPEFDHFALIGRVRASVESVIRGKQDVVRLAVVTLLARGHLLIEDVPGIGKTTLANALARSLELTSHRIQFTSDLLPADIVGLSIFDQAAGEFQWRPGPIFANIVLADEINRATPKSQSALLEAMAEEQVTVDGTTRRLPEPFMVIATQNPVEHHGTYPLPESQLDRFMLRIQMGYPGKDDERGMLHDREFRDPIANIQPQASYSDVIKLQEIARRVRVDEALIEYLLQIVDATRRSESLELGVSPRGSLALFRVAQANALVDGRDYCIADDVKNLVLPCFAHRIVISSRASGLRNRIREAEAILSEILTKIAVPI
ncbi:MAG: MoxR family ATPase [Acidobacteria bacterium]|nr:MoxR family ATPase [Acidobacteriota bacterium]